MYEDYFELSANPFRLTPDAAFYYPSSEHQRGLSFLHYGVEQGDGFIVITGDVGAGKTTLVQMLLQELEDDTLIVGNIVSTQLKDGDVLELVAAELGFRVRENPNQAALLHGLQTAFTQHGKKGRRVLLIVDEAQNLTPRSLEALRMLSNFQLEGQALVQVFLIGQPEFREMLLAKDLEQLRQRVIASYHLKPLTLDETCLYIKHRLKHVGWDRQPAFRPDAYDVIFDATDGVPRRINTLCDRLLLFTFLEENDQITAEEATLVAEEIEAEFQAGRPIRTPRHLPERTDAEQTAAQQSPQLALPLDEPGRLEPEDLQQRLETLEQAMDNLETDFTSAIDELKEGQSVIRLLLENKVAPTRKPKPRVKKRRRT